MNDDPRIDPADLRSVRFPGSFRRYEARAVDEFLESVAQRVEATNALVDEMRRQLESAGVPQSSGSSAFTLLPRDVSALDSEPEAEPEPVVVPPPVDKPDLRTLSDDELVTLVGEETAHVLSTARHAADDIRSKAEDSAARVIREATAEANRLVDEAEQRSTELTSEAQTVRDTAMAVAEEEGRRVRAEAEASAEQIRMQAEVEASAASEEADRIRAQAEEEAARTLENARTEGRTMVGEAKEVRARILADLQRRRDAGRSQVERLASGRQRLLDAYATVRTNVEDITAQLEGALVLEADPEEDDLEEEIAAAEAHVAAADADRAAVADPVADEPVIEPVTDEAQPVPEPEPEPEPDPEPEPAESPDGHLEPEPVEEPVADEEAVSDEEPGAEPETEPEADDETAGVDALFARIRSGRAESVARAQQVLADGEESDPAAEIAPDADVAEDQEPPAEAPSSERADPDQVPADLLATGSVHQRRTDVMTKLEKSLSRALKRHLADEQNQVLDALRQSESTDIADLMLARSEQIDGYADVAIDALAAAAEAGVSAVDGGDVEADVGTLAVALAESLIDPFRRRIEDSAAEVDGDSDVLDERLRALYREWKVERIGPAVFDALLSAFAAGQFAAAPDGANLRWLIDPDQGPCPDAQDNALAGAVLKGEPFPTGDACPQAHPGCRCLLAVEA